MKTIFSLGLVALFSAASAFADQQLSTNINVTASYGDSVFFQGPSQTYNHSQTAPPGTSLSDSGSSSEAPYGSGDGSVNLYYGSCGMTASGAALTSSHDGELGSGGGTLSAQWISQITINSPGMDGQPATIRLTYHASGAVSGTSSSYYANSTASYSYSAGDSGGASGISFSGSWDAQSQAWGGNGSPNRTFTLETPCTVGQPCEIVHNVSWSVTAGTGEPDFGDPQDGSAQASGNLNFSGGSYVVLDPDGNLLDYTANSPSGSAQAVTYPVGTSFGTFVLTNQAPDRLGTTVQLLDGTASAPTQVAAAFVAPPVTSAIKAVSDALELTGTAGMKTVVQMNYNPSVVAAAGLVEGSLRLAWHAPLLDRFIPAVFGNSGAVASLFKLGAYNPATDFQLGKQGLDTVNHKVWAVVDHNSEFVVTAPQTFVAVRSITRPAANTVSLSGYGQASASNRIETSTDLLNWTTLATVTADASGAFSYNDTAATGSRKFYRIAYP